MDKTALVSVEVDRGAMNGASFCLLQNLMTECCKARTDCCTRLWTLLIFPWS